MNDEIKINKSNKSITFINDGIAFSQFGIADEILNLITNLQQENESWRRVATKNFNDAEDYKSRIDKAIEIIEKYNKHEGLTMYHDTWQHLYPVLNILKGESNE